MGAHHALDAIRDELARRETVFHAGMAHGDAVVHADGVELERYAAGLANGFLGELAQFVEVHVSGDDFVETVADGDKRFVEIFAGLDLAGGPQEGTVGSAFKPFLDNIASHGKTGPSGC